MSGLDSTQLIDVGEGITLGVARTGSGPSVLLIGGLGMPSIAWTVSGIPAALEAAGFEVIMVNTRGIEPSSTPPAPYSVDDLAGDIERLLDVLGIEAVRVVAYSMGCYVTQALHRRMPQLITAATLLAGMQSSPIGRIVNEMELGLLARYGEIPPEVMVFEQLMTTLPTSILQDPGSINGWHQALTTGTTVVAGSGLHGQLRASYDWMMAGEPTPEHLADMTFPALVVAFEHDLFFPPTTSRAAAALMPDAVFVQLDDHAHGGLITGHDGQCAKLVSDYLTSYR